MNTIITFINNPTMMASIMAFILGVMMCLAMHVVKHAITERDALHEQQYNVLYDKYKKIKQRLSSMSLEHTREHMDLVADFKRQMVAVSDRQLDHSKPQVEA